MKNSKGITLIALVITIVIMLILVTVTIDISTDGGLIKTSRKATGDANWEAEEEDILNYIYSNPSLYNSSKGKADLNKIKEYYESQNWTTKLSNDKTELSITKGDGTPHIIKQTGNTITNKEKAEQKAKEIFNEQKESYYNIAFKEDLSNVDWSEITGGQDKIYIIFMNDNNPNIIYEFYVWKNSEGNYTIEYFPNLNVETAKLDYADGYKYELNRNTNIYNWIFVDRDDTGQTWDTTETITIAPTISNVRILTSEEIKEKLNVDLNMITEENFDMILTKTKI